jgi:hypothetical protein
MPSRVPGSQNASRRRAQPPRHSTTDALEQWVQTRLKKEPTAKIPAREAYADFCRWTLRRRPRSLYRDTLRASRVHHIDIVLKEGR